MYFNSAVKSKIDHFELKNNNNDIEKGNLQYFGNIIFIFSVLWFRYLDVDPKNNNKYIENRKGKKGIEPIIRKIIERKSQSNRHKAKQDWYGSI